MPSITPASQASRTAAAKGAGSLLGGCKVPHLPFFVLPPPFLCAASMSGHPSVLCRGAGREALCWQGLLPKILLLGVSDSPVKAVSSIFPALWPHARPVDGAPNPLAELAQAAELLVLTAKASNPAFPF
jgi:hypothetical protein